MKFFFGVIAFIFCLIVLYALSSYVTEKLRKQLMSKYNDKELVEKLLMRMIWQGQTEEQLLDAIGQPADCLQDDGQTKVLQYEPARSGRISSVSLHPQRFKVTLENGKVVDWDRKQ
ncbi:MAG: hypothetical protein HRU48_06275 [Vibrio sp.]|uniref:hypothetical protein n=1 Tax=Vibrio TaxID=662 RepID=UPI001EB2714D|nr:hypothetical protein [Vibrio sp.]NRB66965.1 hypothetical protein [Vibrio sp.]